MAVYTKFSKSNIEEILSNYSIGKLNLYEGIQEGIENTNYFLLVENKKYILTVYEKRVKTADLPFFSKLMIGLNEADFKCPTPIINNQKKAITDSESGVTRDRHYGKAEWNGKPAFYAKGIGRTTGLARFFFKVDDYYSSYFTKDDNRPLHFIRNINEGGYKKHLKIDFDRNGKGPNPTSEHGVAAKGEVVRSRFLGKESLVELKMEFDQSILKASVPGVFLPPPNINLWISVRRDRCFVFIRD